MKTGLDKGFHDLNNIYLNYKQKDAIWRNIQRKSKSSFMFLSLKYAAISVVTVTVLVVLTYNLIDFGGKKQPGNTASPEPTEKVIPSKPAGNPEVRDNSQGWQLDSRLRFDVAAIKKLDPNFKEISQLEVTRLQSFGTDTDPSDPELNLHESKKYTLQTVLNQQILQWRSGQKILLATGLYAVKGSSDEIDGANVLGYEKTDGKFYDLNGKLMNLTISSRVKIVDGELEIK
ncbi:hypothetical protein [Bacillus sp. FJAT-49736]|uniref:hypothetical protein n=1 Tax=Bacillus sp. FJAT-49736 TaxID=2833582 RepID=UPI001BC91815|nr:hypothetical protein [Bacillus sp. FJAT-49736]MBS4174605.1 hypothetical protein [Bacillus sp. FJAT-49736]